MMRLKLKAKSVSYIWNDGVPCPSVIPWLSFPPAKEAPVSSSSWILLSCSPLGRRGAGAGGGEEEGGERVQGEARRECFRELYKPRMQQTV